MEREEELDVLVVDDERDIRDGSARALSRCGFHVRTAKDGEEGLSLIEEKVPDVLLLDLMMPGIGGMEVLERVREAHPDVLILVITGYATIENAVEAMKKGAYDFLPKPFTPDQLRIVVRRAAERRRLTLEAARLAEERRRTLADLDDEKSRTRTILNSLADGVLVTDRDGRIALANPAAVRMLGIEKPPAVGTRLEQWVSCPELLQQVERVACEAPPEGSLAVGIERDDGTWLDARSTAVRGEGGAVLGVVTVLADVTDFKLLDRLKSEFVTKVSHELRSPLSSIDQQIAVVLGDLVEGAQDEQRARLSRVQIRTRALIQLVSDLLDLSRIEAGRVSGEATRVDVGELLRNVVDMLAVRAEAKEQVLSLEAPADPLPPVVAASEALESVFVNLVTNAITYTPEGGHVTVRASAAPGELRVAVADDGLGIEARHIPHIFDRFYRVKNERTRFIPGTGLGLAIVKRILDDLGGRIEVESEPDKGSTFTVSLPAESG